MHITANKCMGLDMKEKMLVDAKEVAQMLGVSLRKLEYLILDGKAPAFTHIGRTRKWRINDIDEWIEKLYQKSSN
jgi:excisionase family DNA binding protein